MDFEELEEWIVQQKNKGLSDTEIRRQLRNQGFSEQNIDQAFQEIDKRDNYNKESRKQTINRINNRNSQNNYDKNSFSNDNSQETENNDPEDLKIDDVIQRGIDFFKSDAAKQGFPYMFVPIFFLTLLILGVNTLEESGSLEPLAIPLGIGLLIGVTSAGLGYVKLFRIILSNANVEIRPIGLLGSIAILLRLGIGYLLYVLIVLIGTLMFLFPGIYLALRLYFFNYAVMQGQGVISSFKTSWDITRSSLLKVFAWHFTATFLGTIIGLIFRAPSELIGGLGYSNVSVLINTPAIVVSTMATTAALSAVYNMLLNRKDVD